MRKKTFIRLTVFAFCLISLGYCGLFTSKKSFPERILWYEEPADFFEEALPLGNGRMGAMVYGTISSEHILLNEETLWAGGPVNPKR